MFKLKSIGQFFASFNPVPSSPTRAEDKNFIQLTKTVTVKGIVALNFIYTDLFFKAFYTILEFHSNDVTLLL